MDRESDSNLIEELSVLSSETSKSHYPNSFYGNRHEHNQNVLNSAMSSHENYSQDSNDKRYSEQQMVNYLQNLYVYLQSEHPKLANTVLPYLNSEIDDDNGRNTPLKFGNNHSLCKLDFPGLIYQMMSNSLIQEEGIITISDEICCNQSDLQVDEYPGPLTVEKTTEEQIYSYLKDQMSFELQDSSPVDWDSRQLLINFLELMIKENGKPIVGNIVRLLNNSVEFLTGVSRKECKMNDTLSRSSFSRASSRASSRATSRASSRPTSRPASPNTIDSINFDLPQNSLDLPKGPGSVTSIIHRATNNISEQKLNNLGKYRKFVLSGLYEEAVRFAAKSGIWDHAFALALRMNNNQLINEVLISFSRRAINSNDPLYTMHELMARKAPKITAVNHVFSNNEMGDWRCHLGMILSVKKYRPEECRQSIEALGEKLAALRNYFAAHLCYLLAGTPFGLDKTSTKYRRKFDLIGWQSSTSFIPIQKSTSINCRKLFTGLKYWNSAPEQCIKLTEIYEYALKLKFNSNSTQKEQNDSDHQFQTLSAHLLPYKYLMVYKMLSKNQVKSAYEYCMNIGDILGLNINWLECESINFRIISNIRDLSHRLNSWLTFNEDSIYLHSNTSWLSNIDNIYKLFCQKYKFWNPSSPGPNFTPQLIDNIDHIFNQSGNLISSDNEKPDSNYSQISNPCITESMYYNTDQIQLMPEKSTQKNNRFSNEISYQNHSGLTMKSANMQRKSQKQSENEQNEYLFSRNEVSQNKPLYQHEFSQSQSRPISNQFLASSIGQNPNLSQTKPLQQQYNMKLDNSAFRDIAPPSELPNYAIMTEPPRYSEIKNSTGLDRSYGNQIHYQRYPYEKYPVNEPIVPNKAQHTIINQKPISNPQPEFYQNKNEDLIVCRSAHRVPSSDGEYQHDDHYKLNLTNSIADNTNSKQSTFMPSIGNLDTDVNSEDCFASFPQGTRSRSQSNGSVSSLDHQRQSRSRNSSESKDNIGTAHQHSNARTLETTREETESVTESKESKESKSDKSYGWFSLLQKKFKPKEIHLPTDDAKTLVYDEKEQKWLDKSNPKSEKPITPPPMGLNIAVENLNSVQLSQPYQDNHLVKHRYKPAATNVKPSTTLASPPPILSFTSLNYKLNGPEPNENNPQFNDYKPIGYGSYNPDTNHLQYSYPDQFQLNNYNLQPSINSRNF